MSKIFGYLRNEVTKYAFRIASFFFTLSESLVQITRHVLERDKGLALGCASHSSTTIQNGVTRRDFPCHPLSKSCIRAKVIHRGEEWPTRVLKLIELI